jgi:hypothetical protein
MESNITPSRYFVTSISLNWDKYISPKKISSVLVKYNNKLESFNINDYGGNELYLYYLFPQSNGTHHFLVKKYPESTIDDIVSKVEKDTLSFLEKLNKNKQKEKFNYLLDMYKI